MFACRIWLPALLLAGCTLHHVREEGPFSTMLGGEPAAVQVEKADTARGGQRILVTVRHTDAVDLDGAIGSQAELSTPGAVALDTCRRDSLERTRLSPPEEGRVQSRALFICRWPLTQPVVLHVGDELLPVLQPDGQTVIGPRPWQLSAWVKSELGIRVTGVPAAQGEDLGVNLGARGLLAEHASLGARADVLIDSREARGQFLTGPELGYVNALWPCQRCSIEATVSYLLGYQRGFAHGPEGDVRFGVRVARTGDQFHGIELGVGYRHLIGPDSGGSVVLTLSYTLQTSLRWGWLPQSIRARPRELQPDQPPAAPPPDSTPDDPF